MPKRFSPLDPSSSPLALFGSELRTYRERAGLSHDQLGSKTDYTGSYVGAVERAQEMPKRRFAVAADLALETVGALTRLWDGLLKPSVYPPWFDWPIHEAEATLLRAFELSVVYGLLQTGDYARDLLYGDEAAVEARIARQSVLTREDPPPPLLVCVLDETVLRREVGSPAIMYAQLRHLVQAASERVSIHVIPSRRHRGISGSFVLATLEDRSEVAYIDTAARGVTTGEPQDLRILTEKFESIRSRALPVDQSPDLITRTADELWT
ncbi:helix-turn-helix domain-containing protein [Actinomadura sp. HBU206391]|uniref:helix-turn-helix domain-containing protein n=1 Tax=Actinomadura sp. HBU206391 TaxID=2731692 RepID=UPI00165002AC|nr:helix-turn-helix transcriptional regulator [Actinomadura sp. HBU206391]MBC6459446.1 helix-turn-helix domain-containing protein [Actinomadura sp. HBU206391]